MDNTIIKELAERAAKAEAILYQLYLTSLRDDFGRDVREQVIDAAFIMGWTDEPYKEVKKDAETKLD